jgi:hypothetical protein
MRTLAALSLLALFLGGCTPAPEAAPTPELEATTVATNVAPAADPVAAIAQAPASLAFGTWLGDGVTLVVTADGAGPVSAGVADLQPYTVTSATADQVVLRTSDGTDLRIELGDSPSLRASSYPDLTLTLHR